MYIDTDTFTYSCTCSNSHTCTHIHTCSRPTKWGWHSDSNPSMVPVCGNTGGSSAKPAAPRLLLSVFAL